GGAGEGDADPPAPVGEEPDRDREDEGGDHRHGDHGQDPVRVEAEVVADLRQQDAERGAVELVHHVETEEDEQRVDGRTPGGALGPPAYETGTWRPGRGPVGRVGPVGPAARGRRGGRGGVTLDPGHRVTSVAPASAPSEPGPSFSLSPPGPGVPVTASAGSPPSVTPCSARRAAASSTGSGGGSSPKAGEVSTRTSASRLGSTMA